MKGNVIIQIFVCVAIFATLFLGSFQIGDLTLRNVVALVLGTSIIFNASHYKSNKIFNTFLAFVAAVLFCTMMSGDLFTDGCLKFLIGYHFTSIVVFIALFCLLSRLDSIGPIILFISAVFLLNAILTIAQSLNYDSAWQIVSVIYSSSNVSDSRDLISGADSVKNIYVCGGLCGTAIGNGYFTSVFYPLATLSIWKNNKLGKVYSLFVIAITFYSSFCIQQRMCFYLVSLYSLYMFIFSLSGRKRFLVLFVFAFAFLFIEDFNLDLSDLGHISQTISEDYGRHELINQFYQFLHTGNIVIGGQVEYLTYGLGQHNTFMDCMTRYGLIGTSFLMFMYFGILVRCIKSFIDFRRLGRYELMVLSVCPIMYLFYSLTHSTGLQSGDALFWIVFVMLCVEESKYNSEEVQ